MNVEAIVSLAATVLLVFFGGAVFLANPRSPIGRIWLMLTSVLATWAFGDFGIHLHESAPAAESFLPVASTALALVPSVFLDFSLAFYGRSGRARLYAIVPAYGIGLTFAALALHGYFFSISRSGNVHAMTHGEGYEWFRAWLLLCLAAGFVFLVIKYRMTRSRPERSQVLLFLLSLAVPAGVALCVDSSFLPEQIKAQPVHLTLVGITGMGVAAGALLKLRLLSPIEDFVAGRVLDSAGDLVCAINGNGYITFATEAFRKALAVPADRAWGAVHVKDFVVEFERVYEMLTEPFPEAGRGFELRYRAMDGREFPASVAVTPMVESGRMRGLILIARDVSERRELARLAEESEEKYRNIVDSSLDGLMVVQNAKPVFVNASAVRIFEYESPAAMLAVPFEDLIAPGSKAFFGKELFEGEVGKDIFKNYELKGLTRTKRIIDLEMNARIIRWNGSPAMLSSLRDITERKTLEREQALWFWEQEALTAIDRQLVAMVDLEDLLNLVARSARAFARAEFTGVILVDEERETYVWRGVWGNVHPVPAAPLPLLDVHRDLFLKEKTITFSRTERPGLITEGDFPVLAREGLVTAAGFPFGIKKNLRGVVIVGFRREHGFKDRELRLLSSLAGKSAIAISNAELYEDLREREQQLEKLTTARVASHEEERRRIAREIHDGLGQMLTAIKFHVEVLEDSVGKDSKERKQLEEIKTLLDSVMTEAREISYNLMPSVLEDFGLVPALQLLCENVSRRLNLNVAFRSHGIDGRLDRSLEVNLYRIVQEALNNVAKHSGASTVDVQLLGMAGGTRLVIEDDGKGFTPSGSGKAVGSDRGIGIVSMRERAVSFGGTLTIESSVGKGTTIIVEIPKPTQAHG
ncbi:MAG: hypothetical protein HBSIN02_08880 [Bacteroidia bacterium]|nr:MAG: hypothetical protein HBSIN02_08880 [Bacteroidia bacterium]